MSKGKAGAGVCYLNAGAPQFFWSQPTSMLALSPVSLARAGFAELGIGPTLNSIGLFGALDLALIGGPI